MAGIISKEKLNNETLAKAVIKLMKDDISRRYKETRELTDEDWEFCEQIDWHPVDEMPLKEKHIKELKKRINEVSDKIYSSSGEFFDSLKSK